ncbi:OPN3 [Branchiostoma lanceolatum]|uniref:OPN3 protein n=1 Tax=Branchiostoma lanceolatum TaxID=7740 RepID=A0A8J9ZFM3_BRALA|nr:OPN3 [Branchiostoma lanceolatum]
MFITLLLQPSLSSIALGRPSRVQQRFCNLVGNTFVLLVSYYRRKKIKPPEVFTVNLAVCDLMLLICAYPWMVASSFSHGWLFGEAGCISYAFFRFMLGLVNIANITALAVVRYLKVCRSKEVTDMSWTSGWVSLAGTWMFGAFWALMPVCGWSRYTREPFDVACTLDYKTARESQEGAAFMMTLFAFCYFIPVAIISFCYTCIVRTVRSSRRALNCSTIRDRSGAEKKLTKIAVMVGVGFILTVYYCLLLVYRFLLLSVTGVQIAVMIAVMVGVGFILTVYYCLLLVYRFLLLSVTGVQIAVMIAVMVGVGFILAWTPYSLVSIYATFRDLESIPVILSILPSMFAKSASIYNPIIYFFMNDSFRRDVTALIKLSIPKAGTTSCSQTAWENTPTGRNCPQHMELCEKNLSPAKTTTTALITHVDGREAPSTWV